MLVHQYSLGFKGLINEQRIAHYAEQALSHAARIIHVSYYK
jgi:hypothetical protein